jgi:hypothetical protein
MHKAIKIVYKLLLLASTNIIRNVTKISNELYSKFPLHILTRTTAGQRKFEMSTAHLFFEERLA